MVTSRNISLGFTPLTTDYCWGSHTVVRGFIGQYSAYVSTAGPIDRLAHMNV